MTVMRRAAAVALGLALVGCSKDNPLYCEVETDCETYQYCDAAKNACTPKQDGSGGGPGSKEKADAPRLDLPIDMPADLPPDVVEAKDAVDAKDTVEAKDTVDAKDAGPENPDSGLDGPDDGAGPEGGNAPSD